MATLAKLLVEVGVKLDGALKTEQSIKKLKGSAEAYGKAQDRATEQAQSGFRRLGTTIGNMARRARGALGSLIQRMGGLKTIALASGAAIGAAGAGLFAFVDSQTSALDAQNKLSASLGIGVEELQRLQFAASQSGLSADGLRMGMLFLNKSLLDVAQGGGKAFESALGEVGLSMRDIDGLSRTQQIGIIGDALNNVSDDATRAALAGKLFGEESGPKMASLLREGTSGITALTEAAQGVFTQEDADRASRFQDRLGEIKNELSAVSNAVLAELLPQIEEAINGFQRWLRQNDEFIRQDLPSFLASIGAALASVAKFVANVIRAVSALTDAWNRLVEALGPVGVALEAVVDLLLTMVAPVVKGIEAINSLGDAFIRSGDAALRFGDMVAEGVQKAMQEVQAAAAREARERHAAWREMNPDFVPSGPAPGSGGPARTPSPQPRRSVGGGGGGRASARAAAAPAEPTASGVTLADAIQALRGGNLDALNERLRGMSASTPSADSIRPTVAMTVTINNYESNFDIDMSIGSTDPKGAGDEVVRRLRSEYARAGLTLSSGVVR